MRPASPNLNLSCKKYSPIVSYHIRDLDLPYILFDTSTNAYENFLKVLYFKYKN